VQHPGDLDGVAIRVAGLDDDLQGLVTGPTVVVVAAGWLTDLQRGRDVLSLAQEAQAIFSQSTNDLQVALTIGPARWAQTNTLELYLFDANGQPMKAREASLRFIFLDQTFGPSRVMLEPRGNGLYLARGNYFTLGGKWKVEVTIQRADGSDTFVTFPLDTGVDGVIRPLSLPPTLLGRLSERLTASGGWLIGSGLILFAFGWVIPTVLAARARLGRLVTPKP